MAIKSLYIHSDVNKEDPCARAMISVYNKICNPFQMNKNLSEERYFCFVPGNGGARNGRREIQDRIQCLQKQKSLQRSWVDNMHSIPIRGMIECDELFLINISMECRESH